MIETALASVLFFLFMVVPLWIFIDSGTNGLFRLLSLPMRPFVVLMEHRERMKALESKNTKGLE